MVNNKKMLIAFFNSTDQSNTCSVNSIVKMHQSSAMKGKSMYKSSSRTSPPGTFTTDTLPNMRGQSPSNSNQSNPLTDSPQVLSFKKWWEKSSIKT